MSSHFATSFSSAAQAQPKDAAAASSQAQGGGTGGASATDWSRRVNGSSTANPSSAAAAPHRRPSLSTTLTHPSTPLSSSSSNVYHPPHHYNRAGPNGGGTTYDKDQLLGIFKAQESSGSLSRKIDELVLLPDVNNGSIGRAGGGWGRSGDENVTGAEMCWDKEGSQKPISLEEQTEEERELFTSNVNSPHKIPPNNQGAPNHQNTPPQNRGGKTSGAIGATPGSGRPPNRRRETSDAAQGGNPFGAGSTPPQLARRRTDMREGEEKEGGGNRTFFGRWGSITGSTGDDDKDKDEPPLSAGGRNTGLFRRGSAWGSTSGGFSTSALNSPMGSFGNGAFPGGAMGGFSLDKSKKASTSTLPKVEDVGHHEENAESSAVAATDGHAEEHERQRPTTSDTDPYGISGDHGEDMSHSPLPTPGIGDQQRIKTPFSSIAPGSATTPRGGNTLGTPTKTRSDMGFSAFGPPREFGGIGGMGLHQQLQNLQLNQQQGLPIHGRSREGSLGGMIAGDNEPLSPTETNPYQSPAPEKADDEDMGHDSMEGGGGLGSVIAGLKRGNSSGIGAEGSDRSGRSSVAGLGTSGLGGFGSLGGASLWGGGQAGTPGLGTSIAPSSSFFGGVLGDLNNPSGSMLSGGMGGMGGFGGSTFGSASRASRLGQFFPENQMQAEEAQGGFEPNEPFGTMAGGLGGGFGSLRGFGGTTDSPLRERGDVADLFGFPSQRSLGNIGAVAAAQDPMFGRAREEPLSLSQQIQQDTLDQGVSTPGPLNSLGQPLRPPPGAIPPAGSTQHVMVMPDKIKWVYRDPSGTVQGPFSGLEMHDWYRAGFFSADLAVKRQEDAEFDPLGTLVRKIGNTREPFLVPLPGTQPAGTSTSAATANLLGSSWLNDVPGSQATTPAAQPSTTQPGAVQPPFAGSFPTFGTTLTADQQNALERRKQEEQYLMAKQREYLVQQQIITKQASMQHLHHHGSTQSLHSQPSFGSLHSPGAFPAVSNPAVATTSAVIAGQNSFEPGALLRQAAAGSSEVFGGQQLGGMPGQGQPQMPEQFSPPQQQDTAAQMQQQQRIVEQQRQQLQRSYQQQQHQQVEKQLQQAQEQAQAVAAQVQQQQDQPDGRFDDEYHHVSQQEQQQLNQFQHEEEEQRWESEPMPRSPAPPAQQPKPTPAASSPAPRQPQSTAWGNAPPPLVAPFPSAPVAQQQDAGPTTGSPAVETPSAPSVAPWAKENAAESAKTPSLREIQELEAKNRAAKEAAEAQARAQSMAQQATHQPPPPAPGLPSTATWATSPSTTPSTGGASAWNKPLQKTATVPAGGRKTLQQIQKEEEARKAKLAAQAAAQNAANSPNPTVAAAGKRYADLASKAAQQQQQQIGGGGWTTVGAGGKSKAPGTPTPGAPSSPAVPVVPTAPRSLGSGVALGAASPARKIAPAVPTAPKAVVQQNNREQAQEEFMKWVRASLKGVKPGVNPDEVINSISGFPSDAELIADTIYTVSSTMDGRRFAEEYMRRRNAAQSGVIIEAAIPQSDAGNGGGWNEVAKGRIAPTGGSGQQQPGGVPGAGPGVPETNSAFKVVAGKKKRRG